VQQARGELEAGGLHVVRSRDGEAGLVERSDDEVREGSDRLRREVSDQRRLLLETSNGTPPTLGGATLVRSEAGRHEYTFDATQTKIAALLEQAAGQTQVLDVETHRAPIDEVIADIYRQWQR